MQTISIELKCKKHEDGTITAITYENGSQLTDAFNISHGSCYRVRLIVKKIHALYGDVPLIIDSNCLECLGDDRKLDFVLRDGDLAVDLAKIPLKQKAMFETMKESISEIVSHLRCPNDEDESHITVILNVGNGNFSWQLSDWCCDDFNKIVGPQISQKWH